MTTQIEKVYEEAKETSKKIRAALKTSFPGVKFSVRSETYSGGSSVNVSWTDLPLQEDVDAVLNKFKSGSFNGMDDYYETTGYMMDGKCYVGAKYVFSKRYVSDERKVEIKAWMENNYAEVNEHSYDYYYHFNQAEKLMIEEANKTVEVAEVETNELVENVNNEESVSLTVEINEELNGIELYFSAKPAQGTIELLKENGFRWHKRGGYWYAKQTPERLLIVEALQSALSDITAEDIESEQVSEFDNFVNESMNLTHFVGFTFNGDGYCAACIDSVKDQVNDIEEIGVVHNFEEWENGLSCSNCGYEIKKAYNSEEEETLLTRSECVNYIKENNIELNTPLNTWTTNELREYIRLHKENIELKAELEAQEEAFTHEYNNDGKVKVKSIEFIWSESAHITDNTIVSTFAEAEEIIKEAAFHAPDNGCYDKTKFCVQWSDGYSYEGRLDIIKSDMFKDNPLKDHILEHCTFYAGTRKPSHLTQEQYESYISDVNKQDYIDFMNTYSLQDDITAPEGTKEPITASKGQVLDFTSKFQQKQEKRAAEELFNQFTNDILPYMNRQEQSEMIELYKQNDEDKLQEFFDKLSLTTAVRRAKKEILGKK